jgi:hypothetical protein
VVLRGVRLGEVEDVLLDPAGIRVLGFVVLCGDGGRRMLPLAAAEPADGCVNVSSALVLMEEGFYRGRGQAFRELVDRSVRRGAVAIGTLTDLHFDEGGRVRLLDVDGLGEVPVAHDLAIDREARASAN